MLIASWSFLFQRICGGMMTCHFCSNRIRGAVVLPSLASHPWLAAWPTTLIQRKSWTGACLSARTGLDSLGGCPCPPPLMTMKFLAYFFRVISTNSQKMSDSFWHTFGYFICQYFWLIFGHSIWHFPGILSDIYSDRLRHIYLTYVMAFHWHIFWHSIRHSIWHKSCHHVIWHSMWHFIWQSFWLQSKLWRGKLSSGQSKI